LPVVLISPDARSLSDTRASVVLAKHMPGLDLLRGIAILAVIFFHGFAFSAPDFPWHSRFARALFDITGFGWTGVNLFFTLSGFLITGNLIDSEGRPNYYSRFFSRRALRILPPYFLILILLGLTHAASLNYLFVCVIFLADWPKLLLHGSFVAYPVLWSLAVEEQFYMVWPWLCRRLRNKGLLALCTGMIVLCPVLRGIGVAWAHGDVFSKPFMIGDNLAIGAAIAILCRSQRLSLKGLIWIGIVATSVSGLVLSLLTAGSHTIKGDALGASVGYSMLEWLTAGMLVLMLYVYRSRQVRPALGIVVFFGEISYGLYLIHILCGIWYDRFFGDGYMRHTGTLMIRFITVNAFAILLAALSKRYFENPMMRFSARTPVAT
jgi:peptidoglycan/LPS O-acetylase OafA/YrhL